MTDTRTLADSTDHVPAGPLDAEPLTPPSDQHAALLATLDAAGVQLGDHDRRIAEWLAAAPGMGWSTVATIASWVKRAAATETADPHEPVTETATACAIRPCTDPQPDALVHPGGSRAALPACEMHASWLLAALPGATVSVSPRARKRPSGSSLDLGIDLSLVRSMARSLAAEHEQTHDGTRACPLCDPSRLPTT